MQEKKKYKGGRIFLREMSSWPQDVRRHDKAEGGTRSEPRGGLLGGRRGSIASEKMNYRDG